MLAIMFNVIRFDVGNRFVIHSINSSQTFPIRLVFSCKPEINYISQSHHSDLCMGVFERGRGMGAVHTHLSTQLRQEMCMSIMQLLTDTERKRKKVKKDKVVDCRSITNRSIIQRVDLLAVQSALMGFLSGWGVQTGSPRITPPSWPVLSV